MKVSEDYVRWVREQCEQRGWSKADLARRTGLNQTQTGRLLNREVQTITDQTADKIGKAFSVTLTAQYEIAEGRAARLIRQSGGEFAVHADLPAELAMWLRRQTADVADVVYATARLHGFQREPARERQARAAG